MYDIRNLSIWKNRENEYIFRCREVILEADASKRKESAISMKTEMVLMDIMEKVPAANLLQIKKQRGGKLRFPIYINDKLKETNLEALELSVRSGNCLHRAGFTTIGDLVENISGSEDLKRIRNCGTKSVDEIMERLFCYQYMELAPEKREKFIRRVIELNKD